MSRTKMGVQEAFGQIWNQIDELEVLQSGRGGDPCTLELLGRIEDITVSFPKLTGKAKEVLKRER